MEKRNDVLDDHNIRVQSSEQHPIHLLMWMFCGMEENLDVGFVEDGV